MTRQIKWLIENDRLDIVREYCDGFVVSGFYLPNLRNRNQLMQEILIAQISTFKPDVVLCGIIELFGTEFLNKAKEKYKFISVGHHQAPPPTIDVTGYDMIISSLPNLVDFYATQNIKTAYMRLGADSRIHEINNPEYGGEISFFGSLGSVHSQRSKFLTDLARYKELNIWATSVGDVPESVKSQIIFHPAVYGREMYRRMMGSYGTLNSHIDMAGPYANNLRLYEAPASGTVLLTDSKINLEEMYVVGEEIMAYVSVEDCAKKIRYLLNDKPARDYMAARGRKRVETDHTFDIRASELLAIIDTLG